MCVALYRCLRLSCALRESTHRDRQVLDEHHLYELGRTPLREHLQILDELRSGQELRYDDVAALAQSDLAHRQSQLPRQLPGLGRAIQPTPQKTAHDVDVQRQGERTLTDVPLGERGLTAAR